jgi:hypothetical protein
MGPVATGAAAGRVGGLVTRVGFEFGLGFCFWTRAGRLMAGWKRREAVSS